MQRKQLCMPGNQGIEPTLPAEGLQPEIYSTLEQHLWLLNRFSEMSNTETSIIDLFENRYIYYKSKLNNELDNYLGHGFDELRNLEFFMRCLKKEDAVFVAEAIEMTVDFLKTKPDNERCDYKLLLDVCLRHPKGYIYRVIHQPVVFETRGDEKNWLVQCQLNLVGKEVEHTQPRRQLMNTVTKKLCLFNKSSDENTFYLTPRELEVLKLITRGYKNQSIANKLFISNNTVCNHRRHILSKTQLSNMMQAALYVQRLGLI